MSNCTIISLVIAMEMLILTTVITTTYALTLTGHVCRRMAQETYLIKDTRAFLCNERYTTSCGHLDWRRCTRYRVQTCYAPSQRYAIRYKEVEECCPGWQQAAGSCTIPVCHGICQNGGVCSQTGGVPQCSCLPDYHGDLCQHKRGKSSSSSSSSSPSSSSSSSSSVLSPAWIVTIIIVVVLVIGVFTLVAIYLLRLNASRIFPSPSPPPLASTSSSSAAASSSSSSSSSTPSQSNREPPAPSASSASTSTTTQLPHHQHPLTTISGCLKTSRIVQPTAPSMSEKEEGM